MVRSPAPVHAPWSARLRIRVRRMPAAIHVCDGHCPRCRPLGRLPCGRAVPDHPVSPRPATPASVPRATVGRPPRRRADRRSRGAPRFRAAGSLSARLPPRGGARVSAGRPGGPPPTRPGPAACRVRGFGLPSLRRNVCPHFFMTGSRGAIPIQAPHLLKGLLRQPNNISRCQLRGGVHLEEGYVNDVCLTPRFNQCVFYEDELTRE